MTEALNRWTAATGNAKWGVQQAIKTSLELVASEDIKMCWGADSHRGAPCLINSINSMLSHNADHSPSGKYPHIVSAFDAVNEELHKRGVNKDLMVTPIVAEVLLRKMGPLKPIPEVEDVTEPLTPEQFREWAKTRNAISGTPAGAEIINELMGKD